MTALSIAALAVLAALITGSAALILRARRDLNRTKREIARRARKELTEVARMRIKHLPSLSVPFDQAEAETVESSRRATTGVGARDDWSRKVPEPVPLIVVRDQEAS